MERRGTVAALRDIEGRSDQRLVHEQCSSCRNLGLNCWLSPVCSQGAMIERLKSWYAKRYDGVEIVETTFLVDESRTNW